MADQKITELTAYTSLIDTDVLPVVDITTTATKKTTWGNIKSTLKTYFDALYLNKVTGGTMTGGLVAYDHEATGAVAQVPNIIYGTSTTPPAGSYPEGTIYFQYTP